MQRVLVLLLSVLLFVSGSCVALAEEENTPAWLKTKEMNYEQPQESIPNEPGAVKRENIEDLAINGAKLNYDAVSNAKIIQGTIQADRLSPEALDYLLGGPYLSVSYDGQSRLDVTQGRHVYALRLKQDESIYLNTWLINHATFDGEYLFNGTDIEGPIKLKNRDDFIGGIHGDEQIQSIRIIADGADITGQQVELSHVKKLALYIESAVHDVGGGEHLFDRVKALTFSGNTLTVENQWMYIAQESTKVVSWPGCGLYSVFAQNSLGYTTNQTLMPSTASLAWDKEINEAMFWVSGTNVAIRPIRGMQSEYYAGGIQVFQEENQRIKVYFDAIHSEEGYEISQGDVLEAAFQIIVNE